VKPGKASRTAFRVAIRRAAHQIADQPPIMHDPVAVRLVGADAKRDLERAMHKVARDFRCLMVARSRYAEDRLADSFVQGVRQYVVLGAGLDTFAYRNPFAALHVFEVDFPATQEWKREVLAEAGIPLPENLVFVPLDFERQTLTDGLRAAGVDMFAPAFFSWLGVVPFLTLDALRATLAAIAQFPEGSAVTFDYALPPEALSPERRAVFTRLASRLAASGEPYRLFFTPEQIEAELTTTGFHRSEHVDFEGLNERYFQNRADGLKLSPALSGMLTTAWVRPLITNH
jgi:methyltransferase (TIGR00027 family)